MRRSLAGRLWSRLVGAWRRWKYVEEAGAPAPVAVTPGASAREERRLREAAAREEARAEDYRRLGCDRMARESEELLRSLRGRLRMLGPGPAGCSR